MEIRRARKEEMEEIVDAYMDAYSDMEEYCYKRRRDAKRYIKWLFGRDKEGIFVAFDGTIIAFIASDAFWHSFYEGSVGEIHEMFVKREYRRRGIGRKIMERAEEYLASQGMKTLELWVGERNENARKFYMKMGYMKKDTINGWIRMVKRVERNYNSTPMHSSTGKARKYL